MKDLPAFLLNASDLMMETNGFTCSELGAYLRLLLSEWVNGPLPSDVNKLARKCGIPASMFKKMWLATVNFKFEANGNGTLISPWLEQIRERQRKYQELQSKKGKRSAEVRQEKGTATA